MVGMTGMGLSAVALIAGAIMRYAISAHGKGFNVTKIGLILMIAGAIGFVISGILFASTKNSRTTGTRSMHSETYDSSGNSVVTNKEES